ncbi:MAG: DNA repair protein RadC [Bacteroidia bacterium]|nr:DNA repair protein RadC [Bacteroidia bacterium]
MKYTGTKLKDWAVEDRPREKMLQRGINALTDAELLAIILGSGTKDKSVVELAREILEKHDGWNGLARKNLKDLTKIKGIGVVKALNILVSFEINRRKILQDLESKQITSSKIAGEYLCMKIGDSNQEKFYALFLNQSKKIIGEMLVGIGGITSTIVEPRIIFREALNHHATTIIISHNHPSGSLKPSQADKDITNKIRQMGSIMDITLIDHIIVSGNRYFSFADEGLL